jgi:hypothetical protein
MRDFLLTKQLGMDVDKVVSNLCKYGKFTVNLVYEKLTEVWIN